MSSESLISCFTTRNFPHKSDSPINRISPYLVSHLDRIIWIFSDDEVEIAILIFKGSQTHWLPLLCLITRRAVVSRHYIFIGLLPSAPENKVSTSKMELTRVVRAVTQGDPISLTVPDSAVAVERGKLTSLAWGSERQRKLAPAPSCLTLAKGYSSHEFPNLR
ncbi:uncharacterized protein BO72DRAFT_492226 [Aspergillus fijiensis CBS 313.89]|uniref:Uncharacterized protein n=1 Tax=Aspergillus fijiensis CBS 313.89 TaxID=1448319 RepID=A0A8G1S2R2_9EURO|nr:uncharacterized protein BO72DRAFT_492226 [Aspergillus fijiensis CBS 313.89]RAK81396.1 hypothetical protein BO72DRAFT_492226 [Aspergillus fijiensis CBS 313.89]